MPDDPMIEELQCKLDEAQWLLEEDREELARRLGEFRQLWAMMAAKPRLDPQQATTIRAELHEAWLSYFEAARAEDEAHNEELHAKAAQADARSALVMELLRNAHSVRKTVEADNYKGTWEQRENLLSIAKDTEAQKEQFLAELSADQIRQLKDEGVI